MEQGLTAQLYTSVNGYRHIIELSSTTRYRGILQSVSTMKNKQLLHKYLTRTRTNFPGRVRLQRYHYDHRADKNHPSQLLAPTPTEARAVAGFGGFGCSDLSCDGARDWRNCSARNSRRWLCRRWLHGAAADNTGWNSLGWHSGRLDRCSGDRGSIGGPLTQGAEWDGTTDAGGGILGRNCEGCGVWFRR